MIRTTGGIRVQKKIIEWSHCYENSTVIIKNWFTVTNIHFSNAYWSFPFYVFFFLSIINSKTFTGLAYEQYGGCLLINWNCLPVASSWVHPGFSVCCVVFFFFFSSFCVLCPMFPISPICPFLITLSIFSNVYILNISSCKTMTDYCTETHWSFMLNILILPKTISNAIRISSEICA